MMEIAPHRFKFYFKDILIIYHWEIEYIFSGLKHYKLVNYFISYLHRLISEVKNKFHDS